MKRIALTAIFISNFRGVSRFIRQRAFIILACIGLCTTGILGTTYYVGNPGDDNVAGTSSSTPWATISKVNGRSFAAGDSVLFQGGQTFTGQLSLGSDDVGSNTARVVVGSWGSGWATLKVTSGSGVVVTGGRYLTVSRIKVLGYGVAAGTPGQGDGIQLSGCNFVNVDSIETSGFNWSGLQITGSSSDCRISNVYAHHNGYAGILAGRSISGARLYVGYCRAEYNTGDPKYTRDISGSGIELHNVTNSLMEYCSAAFNGGSQSSSIGNGPVGIWIEKVGHSKIQYCIAHNNTNNNGDGGGFDLDQETFADTIQFCLAYKNKAYGLQFWQWAGNATQPIRDCVIRYNIFYSNGGYAIFMGGGTTANAPQSNLIHNNLCYYNGDTQVHNYGFLVPELAYANPCPNNVFKNNIFWARTQNHFFDGGVTQSTNPTFQGNLYWSGTGSLNIWGYTSLTAWANATNQEKVNGALVGIWGDPKIVALGTTPLPTDPKKLGDFAAFKLLAGSPCIDAGVSITSPGAHDFWGNTVPNGKLDIGPNEIAGTSVVPVYEKAAGHGSYDIRVNGLVISMNVQPQSLVRICNLAGLLLKEQALPSANLTFRWDAPGPGLFIVQTFGNDGNHSQVVMVR